MLRVVIDPSVLVAAFISPSGSPASLLRAWSERRFELIASPQLLGELETVLRRDKFRRYATHDEARLFIDLLRADATMAPDPEPQSSPLTRDPKDDYVILLARSVQADLVVSVDADLLEISAPSPLVVRPAEMAARLMQEPSD